MNPCHHQVNCFLDNERRETLRDGLLKLAVELHPLDGPCAIIGVDPAPGFIALRDDSTLRKFRITLEIGRVKNLNKNPVAEKAILEIEDELLKQEPGGGPLTSVALAIAVARLNTRIRNTGVSAREFWTQRNQYTHEQIPISDQDIMIKKHHIRSENHAYSEASKHKRGKFRTPSQVCIGDLVYLFSDEDKLHARNRYLVTSVEGNWCFVKKCVGNQLRANSYKVKCDECYLVPNECANFSSRKPFEAYESGDEEGENEIRPLELAHIPSVLTNPLVSLPICETQDSTSDVPILLGLPETPPDPCSITSQPQAGSDIVQPSKTCDINSHITPRPKRESRPPKYLEDYVRYT